MEKEIMTKVVMYEEKSFKSEEEALEFFSKELEFPDYFGTNIDAFNDCIGDIDTPVIIEIVHGQCGCINGWSKAICEIIKDISTWNKNISMICRAENNAHQKLAQYLPSKERVKAKETIK